MNVLRWILMIPGGIVASGLVGLIIGFPTRLIGIDAFYVTMVLSYCVCIIAAACIAPRHRRGAIITGVFVALMLLLSMRGGVRQYASAYKRSKNTIVSLACGLTGVAAGVAISYHFLKDEEIEPTRA